MIEPRRGCLFGARRGDLAGDQSHAVILEKGYKHTLLPFPCPAGRRPPRVCHAVILEEGCLPTLALSATTPSHHHLYQGPPPCLSVQHKAPIHLNSDAFDYLWPSCGLRCGAFIQNSDGPAFSAITSSTFRLAGLYHIWNTGIHIHLGTGGHSVYDFGGPTSLRALPRVPRLSFSKSQFDVDSEMNPRTFRQVTSSMHILSNARQKVAPHSLFVSVWYVTPRRGRVCGYVRDGCLGWV